MVDRSATIHQRDQPTANQQTSQHHLLQRPGLPGRRLSARRQRPRQTTAFCRHSLSVRCAAVLVTGPLPLQDHKSGTVCHPNLRLRGCHTASSGGYWRHYYPDIEATAQCELLLTAPNRNILLLLLRVCVSWAITGQPRNSVFIRRV